MLGRLCANLRLIVGCRSAKCCLAGNLRINYREELTEIFVAIIKNMYNFAISSHGVVLHRTGVANTSREEDLVTNFLNTFYYEKLNEGYNGVRSGCVAAVGL